MRYKVFAVGWLFFVCLVFVSCVSQQNISSKVVLMEEKSRNDELLLSTDECRYVKLNRTTEESVITHADRVLCSQDMIYIIDRSKNVIVAYDNNGDFISSTKRYIGRAGNEYVNILDAAFDEVSQQVYAYADNPSQIMVFDKYLSLQEVIPIEQLIREIAVDEKNVYILFYDISDYNDVKVQLRSYAKGEWSAYNVLIEQRNIIYGVGSLGKYLTSSGDCCCLSMPFDNHVYILKNGEIHKVWEMDFDGKWFDFASSKDLPPMEFADKNRDNIRSITNICYTDSLLMFNTNIHDYYVVELNTLKGGVYKKMHISNVVFSTPVFTPVSGAKGLFVQMVNPGRIMDYVKTCDERGFDYANDEMRRLYKSFSIEDNPLLIITNLK